MQAGLLCHNKQFLGARCLPHAAAIVLAAGTAAAAALCCPRYPCCLPWSLLVLMTPLPSSPSTSSCLCYPLLPLPLSPLPAGLWA
jgi:hypothetical protein